jgi:hypothetical protein
MYTELLRVSTVKKTKIYLEESKKDGIVLYKGICCYLSRTRMGRSRRPPVARRLSSSTSLMRSKTVERGEHWAGQLLACTTATSRPTPPVCNKEWRENYFSSASKRQKIELN